MTAHRPRPRRWLAALVALAVGAAPLGDVAAQPDPAAQRRARAGELTDDGLAAYARGDGEAALAAFRAAYELVPNNALLLNLGLAAERAGQPATAIDYFERFLAVAPADGHAPEVRVRIAALRERLAADEARRRDEDAARQAEVDRQAREALARDQAYRDQQARDAEARAVATFAAQNRATIARRGRGLRIGGLVAGGAGLVAIGIGVGFGLRARELSDQLSERGALYDPATVRAGEAADRNLVISMIAGGVLLGAGTTLYVLGRRRRADVHVFVGRPGERIGLAVVGSF